MKIVDSLLNRSEEAVLRELQDIASGNGMRVFVKPHLSDVIQKGNTHLTNREFDFYTRSHCDFVLTDADARPLMIVEYDGPLHQSSAKQQERDAIKNELCRRAGIGLLRINDRYVTKLYRGMSVLRWIVEVTELAKAFYEWQEKGHIPWDEPFDPAFIDPGGSSRRFPYWLSAPATRSIHDFFKTLKLDIPRGWSGVIGQDKNGAGRRLSCLYFGEQNSLVHDWRSKAGCAVSGLRPVGPDRHLRARHCLEEISERTNRRVIASGIPPCLRALL